MTDRTVTLQIAKCGECPYYRVREVNRHWGPGWCEQPLGSDVPDPTTIPAWCPLMKEEESKNEL